MQTRPVDRSKLGLLLLHELESWVFHCRSQAAPLEWTPLPVACLWKAVAAFLTPCSLAAAPEKDRCHQLYVKLASRSQPPGQCLSCCLPLKTLQLPLGQKHELRPVMAVLFGTWLRLWRVLQERQLERAPPRTQVLRCPLLGPYLHRRGPFLWQRRPKTDLQSQCTQCISNQRQ